MTRPGMIAACLLGALGVGAALADPSDMYGTWVPAGEQCDFDGLPNSSAFTLGRYSVQFFEQTCETTATPQVSGDGTSQTYTMSCDNGVEVFSTTTKYTISDNDMLMVNNMDGSSFVYARCP